MKRMFSAFLLLGLIFGLRSEGRAYQVQLFLGGLNFPVAMVFLPDGRILFTEKNTGNVRVVQGGVLRSQPYLTVPVDNSGERGLLGITIDPDFATNGYVYIYHTNPSPLENRVVRFRDSTGYGVDSTVLLLAPILTGATNHNGGNVHFGPDRKLYVTIGENANPAFSQDSSVVYGKILRINSDGTPPPDNPYYNITGADKRIWALGLRNSFDFDFDPLTGNLIATENGPTCDDEINLIVKKGNYGWRPNYPCGDTSSLYRKPLLRINPTVAPTGGLYYRGNAEPGWQYDYFFAEFNTGRLMKVTLGGANRDSVAALDSINLGGVLCSLDLETGPDGDLYFLNTTSIYRIGSSSGTNQKGEIGQPEPRGALDARPNPFSSFAFVPTFEHESFTLYDITGKIAGTYRGDRVGWDLSPGVYFLSPEGKHYKPLRIVKLR